MEEESVVLVDTTDEVIGSAPKFKAHRDGLLHRAVSVFIFSPNGELLLQRRASAKYHSAGLWANTCCGHPRIGETPNQAAVRRLHEEMGLICSLEHAFSFVYKAELDNSLTEHEFDHVFVGTTTTQPTHNVTEVSDWRFISMDELARELADAPRTFAAWFSIALSGVIRVRNSR